MPHQLLDQLVGLFLDVPALKRHFGGERQLLDGRANHQVTKGSCRGTRS